MITQCIIEVWMLFVMTEQKERTGKGNSWFPKYRMYDSIEKKINERKILFEFISFTSRLLIWLYVMNLEFFFTDTYHIAYNLYKNKKTKTNFSFTEFSLQQGDGISCHTSMGR